MVPSSSCSKSKSKWLDPCQEAASKSIKCLNRNGGDKAMCQDYFECVFPFTRRQGSISYGIWRTWADIYLLSLGRIGSARRTGYEHEHGWWTVGLRCVLLTRRQINKRKAEGGGLFG